MGSIESPKLKPNRNPNSNFSLDPALTLITLPLILVFMTLTTIDSGFKRCVILLYALTLTLTLPLCPNPNPNPNPNPTPTRNANPNPNPNPNPYVVPLGCCTGSD